MWYSIFIYVKNQIYEQKNANQDFIDSHNRGSLTMYECSLSKNSTKNWKKQQLDANGAYPRPKTSLFLMFDLVNLSRPPLFCFSLQDFASLSPVSCQLDKNYLWGNMEYCPHVHLSKAVVPVNVCPSPRSLDWISKLCSQPSIDEGWESQSFSFEAAITLTNSWVHFCIKRVIWTCSGQPVVKCKLEKITRKCNPLLRCLQQYN